MKFHEGYPDQQTPKEVWRAQLPKNCENNNEDEVNTPIIYFIINLLPTNSNIKLFLDIHR